MPEARARPSVRRPTWGALTITMVAVGVIAIVTAAITLLYAGLSGALACLVFGVVMIAVGRRARYWT